MGGASRWQKSKTRRSPSSPQILLTDIKEEIDSNKIIVGNFNTSLTPMDRSSKMVINKETQALNDTLNKMDLIFIGYSIQKQWNTLSSQVLTEHSSGKIVSWVTNQALVNVKKLKLYQICFPTTTL